MQDIVDGFAIMGSPKCGGRIDRNAYPYLGTGPPCQRVHKLHGVLLNGIADLVDHKGQFTNISVGWSRKEHDMSNLGSLVSSEGCFISSQTGK